jgi:DNA-binding beta-propeller fold protein YncE
MAAYIFDAVDGAGNLFIADYYNNRVLKASPDGAQTTVGSELNLPDAVAVDGSGNVFIGDSQNSRVVKVPAQGNQSTVGSGLSLPDALAVDGAGNVFIGDTGYNLLLKVSPDGAQTTVAAERIRPLVWRWMDQAMSSSGISTITAWRRCCGRSRRP